MIKKEFLDKYHLLQLLHRGVGGEVWLVEHTGLAARRILKIIESAHPQHDVLAGEARLLQQCRHPSIPIIYDILDFDTQTYIIEEYIEGETLKQYVLRKRTLSDSLVLDFSMQLCEILQFLHNPARPILHLDLKPDNLLISNHRLKLLDFGSAICKNQQEGDRPFFGTPAYCAPEMKQGKVLNEQADIYGLGRCMEYMSYYSTGVSREYRNIVNRCLRKERRVYTNIIQVRGDLGKLKRKKIRDGEKEKWYAVTGILSDHDSTMAAQQLAAYLRRRYRKPVLYLDCSPERYPEQLETEEQQKEQKRKREGFVFEREGITIAKRVAPQEIKGWKQRGYRYVVCDFGSRSPLLSGCPFTACFYIGALTEMVVNKWKEVILPVWNLQKTVLLLTGGDVRLAEDTFGCMCPVGRIGNYCSTFQASKQFGRQIRHLLK